MPTATVEPAAPAVCHCWYRRNWKWVAPLLVLLVIIGVGLVLAWPILQPWFHERYAASLKEIRESPQVIEKLGEPIEPTRILPGGSITMQGDRGEASFNFDVKGPKGTAKVSSRSRYMDGRWDFNQLELTFDDNSRLDLTKAIFAREGDDTPKFDPYAKQPEMPKPNLPRNIEIETKNIDIDIPGATK
ncbi:MAG: hypothetical protein IT427_11000 [Pirellulales bacterium]|nr:hypothetical protein [Pirellulales bacterium]